MNRDSTLPEFPENGLVLYRNRPARVKNRAGDGDRIAIEMGDGSARSVRAKDISLLHPGPVGVDFSSLLEARLGTDLEEGWELLYLEENGFDLATLAELLFAEYTPQSAWAAWQLVADGLYFAGTPQQIHARPAAAIASEQQRRSEAAKAAQVWADFASRLRSHSWIEADRQFLSEVEQLARGRREDCRVLAELKRAETAENAHALLLEIGYWQTTHAPYAERHHVSTAPPAACEIADLVEEERLDLTHLEALAIDDEGNRDPDDAVSWDEAEDCLWVHIADVSVVAAAGGDLDLEARDRGSTLYLPDRTVPMMPDAVTQRFGLGLADVSPALSFALHVDSDSGELVQLRVHPSWIAAKRITYAQADARLAASEKMLAAIRRCTGAARRRRAEAGALLMNWPEVRIAADTGEDPPRISIVPIVASPSRVLVSEAMVLAGEAAARFADEQDLPFPFAVQNPPDIDSPPVDEEDSPAGMLSSRKRQPPARVSSVAAAHSGLGVDRYSRVTSPLRRYPDLVAHQQLRKHLKGEPIMTAAEMIEHIGAADEVTRGVRQVERLTRRHWTLVYLMQQPSWQGEAVLIDSRRSRGTALIAELAFETDVHLAGEMPLNSLLQLRLGNVDLARLQAHFEIVDVG